MNPDVPPPLNDAMAIRVGCALAYRVGVPTLAMMMIRPQSNAHQHLVEENLVHQGGIPVESLTDSHGNLLLKAILRPGLNEFRHDAVFRAPHMPVAPPAAAAPVQLDALPWDVLRYTMPSRYCESDKLGSFAWERFGRIRDGARQAQAICDWVHANIEYRYGSGSPLLSAQDVLGRGYGVCRDFAHVMIVLCRALDVPARYAAVHVPFLGEAKDDIGVDFHACCEVHVGGRWHLYDPRHNETRAGVIRIAHGMDAADTAFATFYGQVDTAGFRVWAYRIDYPDSGLEDPVAIEKSEDGTARIAACA